MHVLGGGHVAQRQAVKPAVQVLLAAAKALEQERAQARATLTLLARVHGAEGEQGRAAGLLVLAASARGSESPATARAKGAAPLDWARINALDEEDLLLWS